MLAFGACTRGYGAMLAFGYGYGFGYTPISITQQYGVMLGLGFSD
jgi:hypothetical protein